jgi:tetratricopeptide (TPR) repeat protein
MAKKKTQQADNLQEIESALTRTEQFIEDNQKTLTYIVLGLIAVMVIYLGVRKFYVEPRQEEAQSQMFMAEHYFEQDSFNLAVNGDGNYLGFLDVIDNYRMTKSANMAKYYTGISYLHLGQYEDAIEFLSDFKTDDLLLEPVKEGALGDAYLELGDPDKALAQYKKAFTLNNNEFTSPIYMQKAASLMESMDDLENALALYKRIKTEYPESTEARNVDKFIARVETKLGS